MKRLAVSALLAACVFLVSALAGARASIIEFTITGANDVTLFLDGGSTPDGLFKMKGPYFENVSGTLNGADVIFPCITFYSLAFGGGVTGATQPGEYGYVYFDMYGPALYSGPMSAPVFTLGTFNFFNLSGVEIDTVAIASVSESSTWTMLMMGFAALGFAGLRRLKPLQSAIQARLS